MINKKVYKKSVKQLNFEFPLEISKIDLNNKVYTTKKNTTIINIKEYSKNIKSKEKQRSIDYIVNNAKRF